jgi:hypothetical protein
MERHLTRSAVRQRPEPSNTTLVPDASRDCEQPPVMARASTGGVFEKLWADGETISYVARVRAYGGREKVTLGTNKQGWNRLRAELETEKILQQIERGTWVPPRLEPRADRLEDAMAQLGVRVDETFRVFANRWWKSKQLRIDESTATISGGWATCSGSSAATSCVRSRRPLSIGSETSCTTRPRRSAACRRERRRRRTGSR